MIFPTLSEQKQSRSYIQAFKGYNHNLRINDDEFSNTKNMTCELYPILSTRKRRGTVANLAIGRGLAAKDSLVWIDANKLFYNSYEIPGLVLNDEGPKQLVSIGAYICIFPDKVYLNTKDLTDYGSMEAEYTATENVTLSICKRDGSTYENISTVQPESPKNGDLWLDTGSEPHTLKQYSETSAMWVQIPTVYVKIQSSGIGKQFSIGDGVNISGLAAEGAVEDQVKALNSSQVIQGISDNHIIVIGLLDAVATSKGITVERKLPAMDYVTEANNRLWGCFYGIAGGKTVNEIYCSKLGDFKNWTCYEGISTDSWAASVGTDGEFTGAITHLGYPIFFKEDCFHKVYVSPQGAHQVVTVNARGIQKGSWKSAVIVNETLFYKSRSDVCYYDGSLPVGISDVFGDESYHEAAAGAAGTRYYISMKDKDNNSHLFVYDTLKKIWMHEDNLNVSYFASKNGELYMLSGNSILSASGSEGEKEGPFSWLLETGNIGYTMPDKKYISRFNLRMNLERGGKLQVYLQYDSDGKWVQKGEIRGSNLGTFTLPIAPKRCDHMRIRIIGQGELKLYSIAKILEEGSDM